MKKFEIKDHEPSFLPEGKNFKLVFSDEFDGDTLDETKWDYRTSMMGKEHPAWTRSGVKLDGNSNCVFTLILDENGNAVSSQLQTGYNFMDEPVKKTDFRGAALQWPIGKLKKNKFTHKYGYYECRCRLQQKKGWWTAFWLQSPIIGASLDPADSGAEIDIMESFEPGDVHEGHHVFCGGYGQDMNMLGVGNVKNLDEKEFHRFGVLFDKTGYTFYVDGVEDGKIEGNISGHDEFILISTEVNGYRRADHKASAEAYNAVGDTFLVDYVRVFDIQED